MRRALVAVGGIVLAVALLANGLGYGVNRDRYVAANEAILNELPTYPGARRASMRSSAYYKGDSAWSPVAGYVTLAFFELPRATAPEDVAAFYQRRLADEWELTEKLTEPPYAAGPMLAFRRGEARVGITLESWRGRLLEVYVDHAGA